MRSNAYCGNLLWQSSLTLQAPIKDLLSVEQQHDRVQWPSGEVMPTWKVYQGCAFSDYRYRMIKDDPAAEGQPNAQKGEMIP